MRKTYKGKIKKLELNQIFVFGSNTEGRHGKGAALWARMNAGAIYGQSSGRQGQSYAICTKNLKSKVHPSVHVDKIRQQIVKLYNYAFSNPELEFLIAYAGKGENLNGYTPLQMAAMFYEKPIPPNIVFEENFYKLIKQFDEE